MSQPGREGAPCAQPGTAQRLSPPAHSCFLSAFASTFQMQQTCVSPLQSPRPRGSGSEGWDNAFAREVVRQCNQGRLTPIPHLC